MEPDRYSRTPAIDRMKIAVVGSGVSGLGAAWALAQRHDVTLYEADARPGGHANTVEVGDAGRTVPVDTGFIVYNERNYPNLQRLFAHLDVPTEPSEMSFSVSRGDGAFEYKARALGLLSQPRNLASPGYRRMIRDIVRFSRTAASSVHEGSLETTEALLDRMSMSQEFRRDFLLPVVACIWSSSLEQMLRYPADSMVRFLDNHGLLDVLERPAWRTVSGGSRTYVDRIVGSLRDVRLGRRVLGLRRGVDHVDVHDAGGRVDRFDHVVLATHADTSLSILGSEATPAERDVLSAFGYQRNIAVLHRDPSLMPVRRQAWSSWNYLAGASDDRVSLSYWMNRLQNLRTERPVIVTLNPGREPADVEAEFEYRHPHFDVEAVRAQARIPELQGADRVWFCGSYCGNGFHEDGLRAGLSVAAELGSAAPWWTGGGTVRPSRVTMADA
jgi:predicted NAD/FAD-binding protein